MPFKLGVGSFGTDRSAAGEFRWLWKQQEKIPQYTRGGEEEDGKCHRVSQRTNSWSVPVQIPGDS